MRTNSDLMALFVCLLDNDFQAAPVAMWSEAFTSWASVRGRVDDESMGQLSEYETFLRESVVYLKQLLEAPAKSWAGGVAENVLQQIFGHVAGLIAFAEGRATMGKLPRQEESAVLDREDLKLLFGDQEETDLEAAIQRELLRRAR